MPRNISETIHEYSLELLQKRGMVVPSTSVRAILKSKGAEVDSFRGICRFPQWLVKKYLLLTPARFVLFGRYPKYDILLGEGNTYITNDGTGNSILEYNGSVRPSYMHDLRNATILSEALSSISVSGPMVAVSDSTHNSNLTEIAECLKLSCKHIQHEVATPKEAEALLALINVFDSSPNPHLHSQLSAVYCPVSPLHHIGDVLDAYVLLAKNNIPIMIMPMPMMAATSPASIYATAVQANTEFLGTLCIFQIVSPGLPIIYAVGAGVMQYRNAKFSCAGPDAMFLSDLLVEMAHMYRLPLCVTGFVTDTPSPGLQVQAEKMMTGFWAVSSGADLVYGIGMLNSSKTLSLEQLVIDDEMARSALWFIKKRRTISADDFNPTLFKEAKVTETLPYISSRSDVERFRKDAYLEQSVLKEGPPECADELARVHDKVVSILENYQPSQADEKLCREADRIVETFS